MAQKNYILSTPPLFDKFINLATGKTVFAWSEWFDKLHYLLSNRNHQKITAADTINLDARYVALEESSGTYAVVLPAPTTPNVMKIIEMTARNANSVTIALTNVVGGSAATTATFDAVGETLILVSRSAKWVVLKEVGVTLS
jgi:hypothetical protein